MKTIVIGDIHGYDSALRAILQRTAPDPALDRLVLLGDLFDRGPDSYEVFETVRELAHVYGDRFVLLRGNHEDYLLQEKLSFGKRLIWERVGRGATVRSFRMHREKMEDTAPWLRDHTVLFWKNREDPASEGQDVRFPQPGSGAEDPWQEEPFYQCVHAGVMVEPLEANDGHTMVHDHTIVLKNQYSGPLTITGHIALEDPVWFPGGDRDPVTLKYRVPKPLPSRGVICIDTGCGKGGKLTAMVIEGDTYTLFGLPESGRV